MVVDLRRAVDGPAARQVSDAQSNRSRRIYGRAVKTQIDLRSSDACWFCNRNREYCCARGAKVTLSIDLNRNRRDGEIAGLTVRVQVEVIEVPADAVIEG